MPRVSVTPARGARPAPRLYRATAETTESARSAAETSARTDADAPLVEDAVKDVTVTPPPLFTEQPSALAVTVDAPVHAEEAEYAVTMTDVELTVRRLDVVAVDGMHVERAYAPAKLTIDDDVTGHAVVADEYVSARAPGGGGVRWR